MSFKASLTPVLAAILFFFHGFLHLPLSFIILLFSVTSFPMCGSFPFSPSCLSLLHRLFLLLIFPSPSLSLAPFLISLSHTSSLSHSYPLLPYLALSPWWTQLLLSPLSRKTDEDRQKVRLRKTQRGRLATENEEDNRRREERENTDNRRGSEKVRKSECERNSKLWIISEKRFVPHFAFSIVPSLQEH